MYSKSKLVIYYTTELIDRLISSMFNIFRYQHPVLTGDSKYTCMNVYFTYRISKSIEGFVDKHNTMLCLIFKLSLQDNTTLCQKDFRIQNKDFTFDLVVLIVKTYI